MGEGHAGMQEASTAAPISKINGFIPVAETLPRVTLTSLKSVYFSTGVNIS